MKTDINCLSYWFPKLLEAGLPVPKTHFLTIPDEARQEIYNAFDGKCSSANHLMDFANQLRHLAEHLGSPFFLRTGLFSGKHNWSNTCFVKHPGLLEQHIYNLAELSEMVDILGLPWDLWVVREYLPVTPHFIAVDYHDMPACREFRFFVDGDIVCSRFYWPMDSLTEGGVHLDRNSYEAFCKVSDKDMEEMSRLARGVAQAVPGAWSVDILETKRGWVITDMAFAGQSWHDPQCPNSEFKNWVKK